MVVHGGLHLGLHHAYKCFFYDKVSDRQLANHAHVNILLNTLFAFLLLFSFISVWLCGADGGEVWNWYFPLLLVCALCKG